MSLRTERTDTVGEFTRVERPTFPNSGNKRPQLRAVEGMIIAVGASMLLWSVIVLIARQIAVVYGG